MRSESEQTVSERYKLYYNSLLLGTLTCLYLPSLRLKYLLMFPFSRQLGDRRSSRQRRGRFSVTSFTPLKVTLEASTERTRMKPFLSVFACSVSSTMTFRSSCVTLLLSAPRQRFTSGLLYKPLFPNLLHSLRQMVFFCRLAVFTLHGRDSLLM